MENLKSRQGIGELIKAWPLKDVKEGTDVFGECLLEEYLQDVIPPHKGKEIPEGWFNANMMNSLISLSKNYHKGIFDLEAAIDEGIRIAKDPTNYNTGK
jgi:hypothetical protein